MLALLLLQDLSGKVFSAVMLQGANLANSKVVGSQVRQTNSRRVQYNNSLMLLTTMFQIRSLVCSGSRLCA
jgi:uncharacterized protein YjbI with pentapeptide repeats